MPSLKDIRRRIVSIKSTQKITRAMKLVSAAKFARANSAVVSARPYAKAFEDLQKKIVGIAHGDISSKLTESREEKRALVVVISTDRGFCGSLNSNLFKSLSAFMRKKTKEGVGVDILPWGKRARQYASKQKYGVLNAREKVLEKPSYSFARSLTDELLNLFDIGQYDRIYLSFVEFKTALTQQPTIKQLLPVVASKDDLNSQQLMSDQNIIIEPQIKELMERLLKRGVVSTVFRALLEASASEHGARMTAMDSATNNASEVLRKTNIQYARARQAAITKELIEITSGAQAL